MEQVELHCYSKYSALDGLHGLVEKREREKMLYRMISQAEQKKDKKAEIFGINMEGTRKSWASMSGTTKAQSIGCLC